MILLASKVKFLYLFTSAQDFLDHKFSPAFVTTPALNRPAVPATSKELAEAHPTIYTNTPTLIVCLAIIVVGAFLLHV